ncbi:hypothetical protein DL95DRAFT_388688 [Leptodontidium sp. 2 PMI_412]|nr:hypothetical protein DL95DRAFT_388688 [Leptodontidium sp. 2 PMI_412]
MAAHLDGNSPKAEISAPLAPNITKPRQTRRPLFPVLTLLSLAAVLYYILQNGLPFYKTPSTVGNSSQHDPPKLEPFEPLKRYSLAYGRAACWQENGVWIKKLTPVEMSSLGIDRFQDTDRVDDEEFCTRLRMYGASFWELPPRWPENVVWCENLDACVKPTKEVGLEVGFPTSGGVWVLDTGRGSDEMFPKSLGLQNALTMDERCKVIESLGGRFCEDVERCADLARLLGL